ALASLSFAPPATPLRLTAPRLRATSKSQRLLAFFSGRSKFMANSPSKWFKPRQADNRFVNLLYRPGTPQPLSISLPVSHRFCGSPMARTLSGSAVPLRGLFKTVTGVASLHQADAQNRGRVLKARWTRKGCQSLGDLCSVSLQVSDLADRIHLINFGSSES